jgi:hypothetical protein
VEAAGELVGAIAKFAAGVEGGEDQFHSGDAAFIVHLHRDAAAVIREGNGAVRMDVDPDVLAVARQVLVNGVVNDLKDAVVKAAFIGVTDVHTGAEADGFQAFKFLDLVGSVGLVCGYGGGV